MRSAWGHVTHPCQLVGLRVWEVTSGQSITVRRRTSSRGWVPRCAKVLPRCTLSLFLREPAHSMPSSGLLRERVRERKSMYVPCRLLGRLLESGCEGQFVSPSLVPWTFPRICHMSRGCQNAQWAQGGRGPRSRSMGLGLCHRELRTHCWGHSDEQEKQSLVVEL